MGKKIFKTFKKKKNSHGERENFSVSCLVSWRGVSLKYVFIKQCQGHWQWLTFLYSQSPYRGTEEALRNKSKTLGFLSFRKIKNRLSSYSVGGQPFTSLGDLSLLINLFSCLFLFIAPSLQVSYEDGLGLILCESISDGINVRDMNRHVVTQCFQTFENQKVLFLWLQILWSEGQEKKKRAQSCGLLEPAMANNQDRSCTAYISTSLKSIINNQHRK